MRRLAIPDLSLIPQNLRKPERLSDPDLEVVSNFSLILQDVITILTKDSYIRTKKEIERVGNVLIKTGAFNKYVTDKLDKNHLVQVLAQSMKLEYYPKDSPIVHYGKTHKSNNFQNREKTKW